jgi:hypothetical protein
MYLLLFYVTCVLLFSAASAEEMFFVTSDSPQWEQVETACVVTEICGDSVGDSDVRCVRITICGEPIR